MRGKRSTLIRSAWFPAVLKCKYIPYLCVQTVEISSNSVIAQNTDLKTWFCTNFSTMIKFLFYHQNIFSHRFIFRFFVFAPKNISSQNLHIAFTILSHKIHYIITSSSHILHKTSHNHHNISQFHHKTITI